MCFVAQSLAASGVALLLVAVPASAGVIPLGCLDASCNVPGPVPNSGLIAVATGNYHGMALRSSGTVETWGICDVEQCIVPLPNSGFRAIAAGDSHSLGLKYDGSIVAWGSNESAQLEVPTPNSGYVAIAAGLLHNLALRTNGTIVGWGYTPWGDVTPQAPNSGWVAIAAGGYYSMGLKADGSIHKWGCNGPCPVPSPNTGFVAIATHYDHSLAVRKDGSIVAWGNNPSGQLDVPSPNSGFVNVAAGDRFSVGLKSDGTLFTWGSFDQDDVPLPNRGYLAVSANKGVADTLRSDTTDAIFSEAPPVFRGENTAFALAADVDADGDQDLVSADYGADTVSWYENDGGLPPIWTKHAVDAGTAQGPQQVAAGDLDGDGDLDVLSSNFNEDAVFWYENRGASPPVWTKRFVSPIAAWGVHAADLDGDGDMDGIGGNRWDNTPEHKGVEWYENDGASPPAFTVRRISTGFVDAASVHAADLDGDGDTDVLSVDVFRDSVFWFENSGAHPPTWTQRTVTGAVNDPFSVFPADVDGDGDIDVLSASSEDDTIAWHENDGSRPPAWTRHVITNLAPRAIAVHAGDLDGDGDVDVVSAAWGNEIAWYESDGEAPPSFTRHVLSDRCRLPQSVFASRLDADADMDLLASCNFNGEIHWFPSWAAQSDPDGDGVPDAIDCAPGDSTAFAIPGAVRDLRYLSRTVLAWTAPALPSGSGTGYQVLRGSLGGFPVGSGIGEVCVESGIGATSVTEDSVPPPGAGVYHLVRAANACGAGSYGADSSGNERTSPACP